MRNLVFYFFLILPIITFAQIKGDVTIEWEENISTISNNAKQAPVFKGNSYFYDEYHQSLDYNLNLNSSSELNEKTIQITNVVFDPIPSSALGNLNIALIPSTIKPTLYTAKSRNTIQNFLRLSPIIKDNSGFKKIKSFSYTIYNGSTKKIASIKNQTYISNSILASGDWYRFYIE